MKFLGKSGCFRKCIFKFLTGAKDLKKIKNMLITNPGRPMTLEADDKTEKVKDTL